MVARGSQDAYKHVYWSLKDAVTRPHLRVEFCLEFKAGIMLNNSTISTSNKDQIFRISLTGEISIKGTTCMAKH